MDAGQGFSARWARYSLVSICSSSKLPSLTTHSPQTVLSSPLLLAVFVLLTVRNWFE